MAEAERVPANHRGFWVGGLMRCCLDTLGREDALTEVGDVLACAHCSSKMYVDAGGKWRWLHGDA